MELNMCEKCNCSESKPITSDDQIKIKLLFLEKNIDELTHTIIRLESRINAIELEYRGYC